MIPDNVDLVMDSREASIKIRKNLTIKEFFESLGVKVLVSVLPCGDYYLAAKTRDKCLLIERKTITDFANSIKSGRLWKQLEPLYLANKDMDVVIIVEGYIKLLEKFTNWKPQSIMSVMESIQKKYGLVLLHSYSFDWTTRYILAKTRALGKPEEKRVYPIRYGMKPMDIQDRIVYVTEGLTGATLARRLLEKFGTLKNIANATVQELKTVNGIGDDRARLIWKVFNTPYKKNKTVS